jgi:arylformamidase
MIKRVSLSAPFDLRPLLQTKMNDDFRIIAAQAEAESAALKQPQGNAELLCWVGTNERPEFIRQSALLANIWTGFGLKTSFHQAQGQHHFDVIDGLCDPQSALALALLD